MNSLQVGRVSMTEKEEVISYSKLIKKESRKEGRGKVEEKRE